MSPWQGKHTASLVLESDATAQLAEANTARPAAAVVVSHRASAARHQRWRRNVVAAALLQKRRPHHQRIWPADQGSEGLAAQTAETGGCAPLRAVAVAVKKGHDLPEEAAAGVYVAVALRRAAAEGRAKAVLLPSATPLGWKSGMHWLALPTTESTAGPVEGPRQHGQEFARPKGER